MMPLHRFDAVVAREPSVAVHDEGDVPRNGALPKGADEEVADLEEEPLEWGGMKEPSPKWGERGRGHG